MPGNLIKKFDWLNSLEKLRNLDLSNNKVDSLAPRTTGYSVLYELDLSNNNIADVNPLSRWQMVFLESLNLSRNKINDLRDVHFPITLLRLDVSNNRITSLYPEFMVSIAKVQWLRLSHNELSSLSFLFHNRSKALWKVDLAANKIICSCDFYVEKTKLGRLGIVFGDEPFCSQSSDKDQRTSIFALGDTACKYMVSNVCQGNNAFHYELQGSKLIWESHTRLKKVNVSWTLTDGKSRDFL